MISLVRQSKVAICLGIALLSFAPVCACRTVAADAREELVRSLRGAYVQGYLFATQEDESQAVSSLTNGASRNLIRLDPGESDLVLRYTAIRDKKTNATRTYKTEILKRNTALVLRITDVGSGELITENRFPAPEPHHIDAATGFDSLEDCIADFNCRKRGELLCEANRTCQIQVAALICCLTNGQCFSVHLIVKPTAIRCALRDLVPDLEGLVLTQ